MIYFSLGYKTPAIETETKSTAKYTSESYLETSDRLLRNAYSEVRLTGTTILINACTIDSVLQSLAIIYEDNYDFKHTLDIITDKFSSSFRANIARFIVVLADGGVTKQIEHWRATLFTKICPVSVDRGIKIIDCTSTIPRVLEKIVYPLFPSMRIKKGRPCSPDRKTITFLSIDWKFLENYGVGKLQYAIEKRKFVRNYKLSTIIFIGVEYGGSRQFEIKRETIPDIITIGEENHRYALKCSADHILITDNNENSWHTVANCLRPDGEWYLYNDMSSRVHRSSNTCIPSLLIYERVR